MPHYFRGYNDAPGASGRHYVDLSTGTGTYPVVNNPNAPRFPTFMIYGNIDTSNKTWTGKIENADDSGSTVITSITMGANNGTRPIVWLEFHNNRSSGIAHFKNISNGVNVGGVINWQDWSASHEDPDDPYQSREITNKEYCMYTDPQEACP